MTLRNDAYVCTNVAIPSSTDPRHTSDHLVAQPGEPNKKRQKNQRQHKKYINLVF